MKNMTLEKIAEAVGGKLFGTGEAVKKRLPVSFWIPVR